jgi:hypothetical protein
MLVVTIDVEVLFQGLVSMFRLAIAFGVVAGNEVEVHVNCFAQCAEKGGYKFRPAVGSDMQRNTMLGEDVGHKELGELCGGNGVVCWIKNRLLREAVNNDKNSIISGGLRELFNEIHGDRVPQLFRYRKLLQEAVWLVTLRFGTHTCGT